MKKQGAVRSAPSSSAAPYHSFPPLAKTRSLRASSSPKKASLFGTPYYVTMFLRGNFKSFCPLPSAINPNFITVIGDVFGFIVLISQT